MVCSAAASPIPYTLQDWNVACWWAYRWCKWIGATLPTLILICKKNGVIAILILSFDYPNLIWRCVSNRSACQSSRRLRSCRSSLVMRCMSALSSPRSWLSWRAWTLSWWCSTWSADWLYMVEKRNYRVTIWRWWWKIFISIWKWVETFLMEFFLISLNGSVFETCTVKNCLTLCMGGNVQAHACSSFSPSKNIDGKVVSQSFKNQ